MKIRPFVRKFHSSEYLNALASGEICFVLGFSGDIKQAQKRAAEAKNGIEIKYAIPNEGAQLWFDNLAIPRDAKNVAEAHAFINFLQKPEVAAKNSNFISYANGNLASQKFIDKRYLDDKTIYPDDATMRRLYTINAHDPKTAAAHQPAVDHASRRDGSATSPVQRVGERVSAPAPMQPQPLLGMLTHPSFDHRGDDLHGACDLDSSVRIAARGSIASVRSTRKRWRSGSRTTRVP